ncbi:hypothetical protein CEXT_225011 [Caerostris extrusa]|uniref:Uncharacterized protein n=1 Tax=Caerostris extrusa TaxID=172846 RepID=A0AAV4XT56_CAEEX|nr:hypothetical protein CEXT_225011 [Caerostris extrusa]
MKCPPDEEGGQRCLCSQIIFCLFRCSAIKPDSWGGRAAWQSAPPGEARRVINEKWAGLFGGCQEATCTRFDLLGVAGAQKKPHFWNRCIEKKNTFLCPISSGPFFLPSQIESLF